jgi:hypothetical protein
MSWTMLLDEEGSKEITGSAVTRASSPVQDPARRHRRVLTEDEGSEQVRTNSDTPQSAPVRGGSSTSRLLAARGALIRAATESNTISRLSALRICVGRNGAGGICGTPLRSSDAATRRDTHSAMWPTLRDTRAAPEARPT